MFFLISTGARLAPIDMSYIPLTTERKHRRKRKTGLSGDEWRRVFGEASKACWAQVEASGAPNKQEAFRACMKEKLAAYRKV